MEDFQQIILYKDSVANDDQIPGIIQTQMFYHFGSKQRSPTVGYIILKLTNTTSKNSNIVMKIIQMTEMRRNYNNKSITVPSYSGTLNKNI